MNDLVDLARTAARDVVRREVGAAPTIGVVTATSPLTVRFNGASTATAGVIALATYTPLVDDEVVLLRVGATWVALGDLP